MLALSAAQRSLSGRRLAFMNGEQGVVRELKCRPSDDGGSAIRDDKQEGEEGDGILFSWQYLLYYLVCLYGTMVVFFAGWALSRKLDDRSPGTISLHDAMGLEKYMGHSLDVSDDFWRINRPFVIPLALIFLGFVAISRLISSWKRAWLRKWFYAIAGICFTGYLHGAFAMIHLLAAFLNFAVSHVLAGTSIGIPVIWLLNISNLLLNQFSNAANPLQHLPPIFRVFPARYPWKMPFGMLVLRMLSYSLDLHNTRKATKELEACGDHPKLKIRSRKASMNEALDLSNFNAVSYVAYICYPPLYLVGPVLTFKSFANQLEKQVQISFAKAFDYGAWVFLFIGILELFCRCFYLNGFVASGLWDRTGKILGYDLEGADFMALACLNLCFVFLMYHVFWRFSRFWAILDNTWVQENEYRSALYLYSFKAFLRQWNASLHIWLLTYIYKPLGGRSNPLRNTFIVFTFVATWLRLEMLTVVIAVLATLVYKCEQEVAGRIKSCKKSNDVHFGGNLHLRALCAAVSIITTSSLVLMLTTLKGQTLSFARILLNFPVQLVGLCCVCYALGHILLELRARAVESNR